MKKSKKSKHKNKHKSKDNATLLDIRSLPAGTEDNELPFFRDTCADFTKKLRKLMKEYKLPVVIPYPCSQRDGDLDCFIGYVHDKNGQFREKVIVICNKQMPMPDERSAAFVELEETEAPF